MSEGSVSVIVSGLVQVAILVVGFLTLWVKLRYNADKTEETAKTAAVVEQKIDTNTAITTEAKEAARAAERQADGALDQVRGELSSHHDRITALEGQMAALQMSVNSVSKSVDSTRHEIRGHLQTVVNKLDLLQLGKHVPPPPPPESKP